MPRRRLGKRFFAKIGADGGKARGKRKSRGTHEYYVELGRKSAATRKLKAKIAAQLAKPSCASLYLNNPGK